MTRSEMHNGESERPSVLLIEDDIDLSCELAYYLTNSGFDVFEAATLATAREKLALSPNLIVVDINLPDGNGLDILCDLNELFRVGIVVCTARSERELKIACLRDRVDAYLIKPVDPEELSATLSSIFRRVRGKPIQPLRGLLGPVREPPWKFSSVHGVLLSPTGVAILLTKKEAIVLHKLYLNLGHSVARDVLVSSMDESSNTAAFHRLEMLISRLRKKVMDKTGIRLPIRSSYGNGYEFYGCVEWEQQTSLT